MARSIILILFSVLIKGLVAQNPVYVNKYDSILDPLFNAGKTEQVISFLEKKLQAKPKDVDALRYLGYAHLHLTKKYELVRKYYNQVLEITPDCGACLMNIGLSYLQENEVKKGLEAFDRAILIDPSESDAYAIRGKIKAQLGQRTGAFMDFNKAIELSPNQVELYVERAKFNTQCGYFYPALSDINKAVELCPKEKLPAVYYERSDIYSLFAKYSDALADIKKSIELDSNISTYYFVRANIYKYLDSTQKSKADYKTAIRKDTNDFRPFVNLTHLLHSAEEIDQACEYAKKTYNVLDRMNADSALKNDFVLIKEDICDVTKPSYYYHRAISNFINKNFPEAEKFCNMTLEKFPGNYFALNSRADVYYYTGRYALAVNDYSSLFSRETASLQKELRTNYRFRFTTDDTLNLVLQSFKCSTRMSLAQCYLALGNFDKAMTEIDSSINLIQPMLQEKEFPFEIKGTIFLIKGKYTEARQIFDTCIKLNRNSAVDYVNRAVTRVAQSVNLKLKYVSATRRWPTSAFYCEWIFPSKLTVDPLSQNLLAALEDCDKAIELDKNLSYAYYVKAQIKKKR